MDFFYQLFKSVLSSIDSMFIVISLSGIVMKGIFDIAGYKKLLKHFKAGFKEINPLVIYLNAGLFKITINTLAKASKLEIIDPDKRDFNITIAGILINKKAREATIANLALIAGASIHISLFAFFSIPLNAGLLSFLCLIALLISINQEILEYRIGHGFYGKNDYEAREMITFLLDSADKSNFSDGDGLKKLFPNPLDVSCESDAIDRTLEVI